MKPRILNLLLITGLALIFVGCQSLDDTVSGNNSNSPVAQETPTPRPAITPTPNNNTTPTVTPTPEKLPLTLTLWTVEPVSALAGGELGDFFQASIRNFERTNPDLELKVLIKKPGGKGGMLDFLRNAKEVAPSVLPDVAVIDAKDLRQALNEGLAQSLNGKLDRSIVQDLLPAARRIGTVNGTLAGVPVGIQMEHTVYNTLTYTDTVILWSDVLTQSNQYIFPAKGVNGLVNDATLSQYFSAGGVLIDSEGKPRIDDRVLQEVLEFYQNAVEQGIVRTSVLDASTTEELWPEYLTGSARVAQISVSQYLTDRELLNNTIYGPLPRAEASLTPITVMHGWVLVLVATDVTRQQPALKFMEFFLSTQQNAAWNQINKSIPIRDTAFQQLAGNDPYWLFLIEQLNTARPEPGFPEYDRVGRILQQAVEQVIRSEKTAEEAAMAAKDSLTQ
jgi:ABC-type glycerol-3-phosphate transport system substrate-binding protein